MKAWCPRCLQTDYTDKRYRCLWCGELTLKAKARPGLPRSISVKVIREAHALHAEGATLGEAAAAVITRTQYASIHTLKCRLPAAFAGLGLPYRSIGDAQRLRILKYPSPHTRTDVTREHALAAVARHFSLDAAARSLGVSRKTIKRRLDERVRAAGL